MKKIVYSIILLGLLTTITSCDSIDKRDLEYHAEYFCNKGKMFYTLEHTVGLDENDRQEILMIQMQEDAYISSLNSEERDYYFNYLQSL